MASHAEVGPTTPISSPPGPALQPDIAVPDLATPHPAEAAQAVAAAPKNRAGAWARGLLRRVWLARGFFGGLIAMGLAFNAQKTLIEQGDWMVAQRYYYAAFLILILSLIHPTFEMFRRRRKPGRETAPAGTTSTNGIENTVALEPHPPQTNGNAGADDDLHTLANGRILDGNGNGHSEADVRQQLDDLEVLAPLPSRRAGGRAAIPAVSEAPQAVTITESVAVASPPPPAVAATSVTKEVRQRTRPLEESELAAIPARKRSLKAFYLQLREALGWRLTIPFFLVTVGVAAASFFMLQQNIANVLAGWLWFVAMILVVVTFYGAPRWPRALNGLLDGPDEGFFARGVPRPSVRLEAWLVLIMMVGALAIRLWNLEYFPGIFGDEGERGMDARSINEGRPALLWGTGWWAVPNLYFYWIAWSLRIFGDTMVGDRMPSVIASVVTVWAVYKIGRLLWGARAGLIAGSLLAVSPLWLQYSREAGESTPTVMCWALGFLFLFRALRYRHWVDWALSGMGFAFSLYFYASGKMVVPMLAGVGAYLLIRWRWEFVKRYMVGYALLLGTFFLTFMPYFIFLSADRFDAFFSRARETSIFSPGHAANTFAKYGVPYDPSLASLSVTENLMHAPAAWAQIIYQQARLSVDVLYRIGDAAFFYPIRDHNGTLLTPLLACLTLLGLVYFTWKLWDGRYALPILWFWAGMGGMIFTIDVPNVQRLVGAWPVLFLFSAVVIDRVLASAWPLNINFARRWLTVPVVALIAFASVEGFREYFVIYEAQCSFCTATVQARHVQAFGQDYKGYQMGVGGYVIYFTYGSTRFAAKGIEGEDLNVPMDHFPTTNNNGKGLAFILYPANLQYLPIINLFYPDGKKEDIKGNDGSFQFVSYKVTREQVNSIQTTFAEYVDARGNTVRRNEPNLGTSRPPGVDAWHAPPQLSYPMTATWQGGLVAPDYGQYTFTISGASDAVFEIDGEVLLDAANPDKLKATRVLARGTHEVRVSGTLADPNMKIDLLWAGGSGTPLAIGSNFLYNGVLGGLTASVGYDSFVGVDVPEPFTNQVVAKYQINPFISIRDAGAASASFGGRPFFIRWQGTIYAPTDGQYTFGLESTGPSLMLIDGVSIVGNQGVVAGQNPVTLTAGEHSVDIRYTWQGGQGGGIEWYWTPPGGAERAIVPPTVLRPLKRMWNVDEVTAPSSVPNIAPPPPAAEGVKADALLGADAGLSEARGVGVDAQGRAYIGDNGNHRIVVLDASGRTVTTWGGATEQSAEGKINLLGDVWTTPDGHTFTVDSNTGDVHDFNPDGSVNRYYAGIASASGGIAVGPDGKIYIAHTVGSDILVFSPDGTMLNRFEAGPVGTLQHFEQPIDVAVGPDGRMYVVDMRSRVVEIDPNGNHIREWPVQWGGARGGSHLVYWRGKVVMTDPDRHRLVVIDLATNEVSFVGQNGNSDSQMNIPVGIAVGADDKLYVMDSGNNRVLVFSDLEP